MHASTAAPQAGTAFTALPEHISGGKTEPAELQEFAAARQAAGQPLLTAGEVVGLRWQRRLAEVWAPRLAWWVEAASGEGLLLIVEQCRGGHGCKSESKTALILHHADQMRHRPRCPLHQGRHGWHAVPVARGC